MPSRITNIIAEFNAYITRTDDFLQALVPPAGPTTNWERLGLVLANADEWHARRQAWDILYVKYNDPALSTSIIKTQVHHFIDSFREFGGPQLNIMAASLNADETDEAKFNFVITPADPTHTSTHIEETVAVKIKHLGGSEVSFSCTNGDGQAKAEGSDSVQMAWFIVEEGGTTGPPIPPPGSGDDFPDADDVRLTREVFKKSHFMKHFGTEHLKKRVICFFRWYNTTHPELAGPWSEIMAIVIA